MFFVFWIMENHQKNIFFWWYVAWRQIFCSSFAEIAKNIVKIVKQEGPEAPKGSQILEKWGTGSSQRPARLRAGATGKGREGDKSPSQGLGRKGFMILRSWASTRPEAKRLGGLMSMIIIIHDYPSSLSLLLLISAEALNLRACRDSTT